MTYKKITDIKPNPDNPRVIRDENFKKLVNSIKEFPEMLDLRPIVVNKDMVILGGNMRYRACQQAGYKEVPIIIADSLTPEQEREFIIKDNVSGGDWDWDALANEWDSDVLQAWGLDVPDLIDELEDGEEIEIEKSIQLEPPKEYILIMADPDTIEWEEIKDQLKLKMVRRGGYKKGSAFDTTSIERVLTWNDFKERYANSNTK